MPFDFLKMMFENYIFFQKKPVVFCHTFLNLSKNVDTYVIKTKVNIILL